MRFAFRLLTVLALSLAPAFANPLVPFLETHCFDCHDSTTKKGGLDLEALAIRPDPKESLAALLAKWERVHDRLRDGEMPPPKKAQPAPAVKNAFLQSLGTVLVKNHAAVKGTVMRRLNRYEYERTVNTLLGTRVEVADLLPEDGKAQGFDNIGEALDISPVQMQRYLDAAGEALDAAVAFGEKPESRTQTLTLDSGRSADNIGKHWIRRADGAVVTFNSGDFPAVKCGDFRASHTASYRIRLHVAAHASQTPVNYGVYLGPDTFQKTATLYGEFSATPGEIAAQEVTVFLRKGDTIRLKPRLKNPPNVLKNDPEGANTPGFAVLKVEVEGPLFEEWPPRGQQLRFGDLAAAGSGAPASKKKGAAPVSIALKSADPAADIARLLPPFIEAAFRRPVSAEIIAPFIALGKAELAAGAPLDQALRTAQIAVLCAPDFLFLIEAPGRLDDFALAARLSYMLWGVPPDATLLEAANKRELSKPAVLRQQTERLLADARAEQFTESFLGQWLNLREIDFTTPDKQLYPEYDESLKLAMLRETELFFKEALAKNLSVLDFLHSDWTFVNERLARHYRIEGVTGGDFRKVKLKPEHNRGGLLTHASVLKVSANGTTTSPVMRGIYVLDRFLGYHPSPPPPGVPGVEPDIRGATTLRQQLEKHRSMESCNSCHRTIDPPGFALENYDVMGGWRENYRSLGKDFSAPPAALTDGKRVQWRVGPPVDAAGVTPEGKAFKNIADYKQVLLAQPRRFTRALAEKLATYGTGRVMGFSDRATLDYITDTVAAKNHGFRDLVHEVIQSELFRNK